MIGIKVKKKRFTLLYLEENEAYVQDLTGSCTFYDFNAGATKTEKGKIHLCSKSIIFEPNNLNVSIYKFLFREMKMKPKRSLDIFNEKHNDASLHKLFDKEHVTKNDNIIFRMRRIVEINTTGAPSPYIIQEEGETEIMITPAFENIDKLIYKLNRLIEFSESKTVTTDQQSEITKLILEDSKLKFDKSHLESITEKPILTKQMIARRIMPLVSIHGVIYITNKNVYFQPLHAVASKPVKTIPMEDITNLFKRRFELRHTGMEIYTKKKSYFLAFDSNEDREEVYNTILKQVGDKVSTEYSLEHMTEKWQREEISNYDYLMFLNEAADRTFSDLTQYPVFPWIIQDYESQILDLSDPKVYRDLTKPIGALNAKRLQDFKERYKYMEPPRYLYGTHYSAPGYVIGYLVRKYPQYMLKFQSGKFDKPDRLFLSIKKDWHNVMNNHAIVKELIPEFYGEDESFLVNTMKLDLGVRQKGKRVNDVKLPKWARNAKEFLKINKIAIESKYVSDNLHHWIDLIFGYKQQGQPAIDADNVFHPLTYEGSVDLDSITDPVKRLSITLQINEFGQTPKQLFKVPHPPRSEYKGIPKSILMTEKKPEPVVEKKEDPVQTETVPNKKYDFSSEFVAVEETKDDSEKPLDDTDGVKIEGTVWEAKNLKKLRTNLLSKVHKSQISACWGLSDDRVLTIGHDGFLKITQYKDMNVARSFKVCDLSLSSIAELKKNELYALGGWDNNLYIFNLNYGTKVYGEQLHEDAISTIAFDAKNSLLYTGSWDCTIKCWSCKGGSIDNSSEDVVVETQNQVSKIKLSSDGNLLLTGDIEGNVILMNVKNREVVTNLNIGNEKVTSLHFLNDKQIVAAGETSVQVADFAGNTSINIMIDARLGIITDMEMQGTNFIISTDRGNVSVYSIMQERRIGSICNEYGLEEIEMSPDYEFTAVKVLADGKVCAIGSEGGSLTVAYYA